VGTGHSPAPGAVGLIGLGEIGQVHAAAIPRSRTARLAAVADTAPELLAPFEAQGVRGYRDAGELIAYAEVGTVCVCLPHYLHFPVTLPLTNRREARCCSRPGRTFRRGNLG
jgi:UDP-N-acetyl-2-amino-2-deoxyglucuronate dehydrogenase